MKRSEIVIKPCTNLLNHDSNEYRDARPTTSLRQDYIFVIFLLSRIGENVTVRNLTEPDKYANFDSRR